MSGSRPAIVGGKTPAEWGLDPALVRSVVAVRPLAPELGDDLICSGVFVSSRIVITARHCIVSEQILIEGEFVEAVENIELHEERDLALLYLGPPACGARSHEAPSIATQTPTVGSQLLLAGYGRTDANTVGDLLVVEESVAGVEAARIRVDGKGESGACEGDSGGPLLRVTDSGTVEIVGILSRGAGNCVGVDEYVLLHPERSWLAKTALSWGETFRE